MGRLHHCALMKWYTCINEESLVGYLEHLRVAIASAKAVGGLEPHVIFDGDPKKLIEAVGHSDFHIHQRQCGLKREIEATPPRAGWSPRLANGALLRLEIPFIEPSERYVLYTDCDVLFTGRVELEAFSPRYFAAAPGHHPFNWLDICSGVMLLNAPAMHSEYSRVMDVLRNNLGRPHYYDQEALNTVFRGRWDRLPLEAHWKPYWGPNPDATIVHYHGPKRNYAVEFARRTLEECADYPEDYLILYQTSKEGYAYYDRLFSLFLEPGFDREEFEKLRGEPILASSGGGGSSLRSAVRNWRKALSGARASVAPTPPKLVTNWANVEHPTKENFDEASYLAVNADVARGLFEGAFRSGWEHFTKFGRKEGRVQAVPEDALVTMENFDEARYLGSNPDVAIGIARGQLASAKDHFIRHGQRERRRQRPAAD
jgi:hypothetical protein